MWNKPDSEKPVSWEEVWVQDERRHPTELKGADIFLELVWAGGLRTATLDPCLMGPFYFPAWAWQPVQQIVPKETGWELCGTLSSLTGQGPVPVLVPPTCLRKQPIHRSLFGSLVPLLATVCTILCAFVEGCTWWSISLTCFEHWRGSRFVCSWSSVDTSKQYASGVHKDWRETFDGGAGHTWREL